MKEVGSIKKTILRNVTIVSVLVMVMVLGVVITVTMTNASHRQESNAYLSQIGAVVQMLTASSEEGMQEQAIYLSHLANQLSGSIERNIFYMDAYAIGLMAVGVIGTLAGLMFASGAANKITQDIRNLKKYMFDVRDNRKTYIGEMAYLGEIQQDVEKLYTELKNNISDLNASLKEIEKAGQITTRVSDDNRILDARDYNKTVDAINSQMNTVYTLAKELGHVDKSTGVLWQGIKDNLVAIKQDNQEREKEISEIEAALEKIKEGNLTARPAVNHKNKYGKTKEHLIDAQSVMNEFLKDVSDTANNGFNAGLKGNYPGEYGRAKAGIDRTVENNKRTLTTLRNEIDALQKKERAARMPDPVRRTTTTASGRTATIPRSAPPVLKGDFQDIDFTGRSFGKY